MEEKIFFARRAGFHVLVMLRLAAAVAWTRMAGRAALVAMDEARREAATRTAAIVMVVDGLRGEVWMESCGGFEIDGWEGAEAV